MYGLLLVDNESNIPAESSSSSDVVLEVETGLTGERLDGLQALMNQFTEESGIGIELISPGMYGLLLHLLLLPQIFPCYSKSMQGQ